MTPAEFEVNAARNAAPAVRGSVAGPARAVGMGTSRSDKDSPTDMAAVPIDTYRMSGEELQYNPDGSLMKDANGNPVTKNKLDPYAEQALAGATAAQSRGPARMQNVNLNAAPTQEATTVGPVRNATSTQAHQTQIASHDAAMANVQSALAQRLDAQSQGKGPSLAGATLQQGVNAGLKASLAAAASRRGGNDALAQKNIANQQVEANAAAGQEAAKMRIAEQLNAQQTLGGVTATARTQDIGKDVTQAELAQGVNLANASSKTGVSVANAGAANTLVGQQAALDANKAQNDADIAAKYGLTQGELDLQTGHANLTADEQQRQLNDQRQQGLLTLGGNTTGAEIHNAQEDMTAQATQASTLAQIHQGAKNATFNHTLGVVEDVGKGLGTGVTLIKSDVSAKDDIYALEGRTARPHVVSSPVEGKTNIDTFGIEPSTEFNPQDHSDPERAFGPAKAAQQDAVIDEAIDPNNKYTAANKMLQSMNGSKQAATPITPFAFRPSAYTPISSAVEMKQGIQPFNGTTQGISQQNLGTQPTQSGLNSTFQPNANLNALQPREPDPHAFGSVTSDAKAKKNISAAIDDKLENLAGDINGYSYSYKDPSKPGAAEGTHVSPMAHEFKRSPLTRGMVKPGPDGKDQVDYARGFGTLWALVAHQDDRINELSSAFGDKTATKRVKAKKNDRLQTASTGRAH
jgi:hypothetical protein